MTSGQDDGPSLRRVVYARTFREQLARFIEQGERRYGARLAEEKEHLVLDFIDTTLARSPGLKPRHPALGLVFYPVSRTPFIVVYDHDDQEVRVMACLLQGAGERIDDFDAGTVDW